MIEGILETSIMTPKKNARKSQSNFIAISLHFNDRHLKRRRHILAKLGKTDKTAALRSRDWSHNITRIFGQQHQQVPSKSRQTLHNRALQEHIIYITSPSAPRPPKHHTILIPIYSSVFIGPYRPRGRQSIFWRHCQTELDLPILQSLDLWPRRCSRILDYLTGK